MQQQDQTQEKPFDKEELIKMAEEVKREGVSSYIGRDFLQKAFLTKIAAWLNIIKG